MYFLALLLCLFGCTPAMAVAPIQDFEVSVMNGEPDQMYSSAHGKPMLIEFYYNGCSACQANAVNVKAIANEFNNEKTHVVEFSYDCAQSAYDSWIRRHAPTAFVVNGCNHALFDQLDVHSFPTTVILDAQHNVIERYVGTWSNRTKSEIRTKMQELSR